MGRLETRGNCPLDEDCLNSGSECDICTNFEFFKNILDKRGNKVAEE